MIGTSGTVVLQVLREVRGASSLDELAARLGYLDSQPVETPGDSGSEVFGAIEATLLEFERIGLVENVSS